MSGARGEAVPAASREPAWLLALGALALGVSRIGAREPGTWLLEVLPAVIAAVILAATRRRFPLTPLAYRLVFVHALILMIGGHYTYAQVPLGFWVQDALGLARNHYDRLGHFMQGFVPVIVAREVLVRKSGVGSAGWLAWLATCVVLAASAFWEMLEWWAALVGGAAADSFLGTQGDPWDTQWDMFLCLCGAAASLALWTRVHDRALAALAERSARVSASHCR